MRKLMRRAATRTRCDAQRASGSVIPMHVPAVSDEQSRQMLRRSLGHDHFESALMACRELIVIVRAVNSFVGLSAP
jgi:hypothetical protein